MANDKVTFWSETNRQWGYDGRIFDDANKKMVGRDEDGDLTYNELKNNADFLRAAQKFYAMTTRKEFELFGGGKEPEQRYLKRDITRLDAEERAFLAEHVQENLIWFNSNFFSKDKLTGSTLDGASDTEKIALIYLLDLHEETPDWTTDLETWKERLWAAGVDPFSWLGIGAGVGGTAVLLGAKHGTKKAFFQLFETTAEKKARHIAELILKRKSTGRVARKAEKEFQDAKANNAPDLADKEKAWEEARKEFQESKIEHEAARQIRINSAKLEIDGAASAKEQFARTLRPAFETIISKGFTETLAKNAGKEHFLKRAFKGGAVLGIEGTLYGGAESYYKQKAEITASKVANFNARQDGYETSVFLQDALMGGAGGVAFGIGGGIFSGHILRGMRKIYDLPIIALPLRWPINTLKMGIRTVESGIVLAANTRTYAKMNSDFLSYLHQHSKDIFAIQETHQTTSGVNYLARIDPDFIIKNDYINSLNNGMANFVLRKKEHIKGGNPDDINIVNDRNAPAAFDMRRSINDLNESIETYNSSNALSGYAQKMGNANQAIEAIQNALTGAKRINSTIHTLKVNADILGKTIKNLDGEVPKSPDRLIQVLKQKNKEIYEELTALKKEVKDPDQLNKIQEASDAIQILFNETIDNIKIIKQNTTLDNDGFTSDVEALSNLHKAFSNVKTVLNTEADTFFSELVHPALEKAATRLKKQQKLVANVTEKTKSHINQIDATANTLKRDIDDVRKNMAVINADPNNNKDGVLDAGSTIARIIVAKSEPHISNLEKFHTRVDSSLSTISSTVKTTANNTSNAFEHAVKSMEDAPDLQIAFQALDDLMHTLKTEAGHISNISSVPLKQNKKAVKEIDAIRDESLPYMEAREQRGIAPIIRRDGTHTQYMTQNSTGAVEKELNDEITAELYQMVKDGKIKLPPGYNIKYRPTENAKVKNTTDANKPIEQLYVEMAFYGKEPKDSSEIAGKVIQHIEDFLRKGQENRALEAIKWMMLYYSPKGNPGNRAFGVGPDIVNAITAKAHELRSSGENPFTPEFLAKMHHLKDMQSSYGYNLQREVWANWFGKMRNNRWGGFKFNELAFGGHESEYWMAYKASWNHLFVTSKPAWIVHSFPREIRRHFLGGERLTALLFGKKESEISFIKDGGLFGGPAWRKTLTRGGAVLVPAAAYGSYSYASEEFERIEGEQSHWLRGSVYIDNETGKPYVNAKGEAYTTHDGKLLVDPETGELALDTSKAKIPLIDPITNMVVRELEKDEFGGIKEDENGNVERGAIIWVHPPYMDQFGKPYLDDKTGIPRRNHTTEEREALKLLETDKEAGLKAIAEIRKDNELKQINNLGRALVKDGGADAKGFAEKYRKEYALLAAIPAESIDHEAENKKKPNNKKTDEKKVYEKKVAPKKEDVTTGHEAKTITAAELAKVKKILNEKTITGFTAAELVALKELVESKKAGEFSADEIKDLNKILASQKETSKTSTLTDEQKRAAAIKKAQESEKFTAKDFAKAKKIFKASKIGDLTAEQLATLKHALENKELKDLNAEEKALIKKYLAVQKKADADNTVTTNNEQEEDLTVEQAGRNLREGFAEAVAWDGAGAKFINSGLRYTGDLLSRTGGFLADTFNQMKKTEGGHTAFKLGGGFLGAMMLNKWVLNDFFDKIPLIGGLLKIATMGLVTLFLGKGIGKMLKTPEEYVAQSNNPYASYAPITINRGKDSILNEKAHDDKVKNLEKKISRSINHDATETPQKNLQVAKIENIEKKFNLPNEAANEEQFMQATMAMAVGQELYASQNGGEGSHSHAPNYIAHNGHGHVPHDVTARIDALAHTDGINTPSNVVSLDREGRYTHMP